MSDADFAVVGTRVATQLLDVSRDPKVLDAGGFWVVCVTFEGDPTFLRFGRVDHHSAPSVFSATSAWSGPAASSWTSSLDEAAYVGGVASVRERIARGSVYQVNLCRVLSAPADARDLVGLGARLAARHPAAYPTLLAVPSVDLHVCSASPELFLARRRSAGFDVVETGPIKGTGATASDISSKDYAENVMIVDMARNDLGRVADVGTVEVTSLCEPRSYPGLVHLVSSVQARVRPEVSWADLLTATLPPASVSGAPKLAALDLIGELEPVPRGPYCGALGYIDADRGQGELAVGIRTFWLAADELKFGTGAGVTWGSDPYTEWAETELKAERLISLASQ